VSNASSTVAAGLPSLEPSTSKLEPIITNHLGMEFVLIPAGTFTMGSPDSAAIPDNKDEKPAHRVMISKPFYMGKYEVTQGQWEAVMGANPSRFKGKRRPVEYVSWKDIQTFIEKLNQHERQSNGVLCHLPTEAQWEYAARAGSTTAYHFGDDPADLYHYDWYAGNAGGTTHPVGRRKPNAWGLYDMYGNVSEWVQDGRRNYKQDAVTDPQGQTFADAERVIRGGNWLSQARVARSASRKWFHPSLSLVGVGFRCLSPAPSP
jgi:formylglycine-generating enzyme required for sulfatase activity